MRLPPRPELHWKKDGTPVDRRVDDVYYSVEDGLAESRAVFLTGCGFPEAWIDQDQTTIAELGFGTGLNFLATWQAWQQTRADRGWLNFVSFEGYPLDREDIEKALRPWPELQPFAEQLCLRWPIRAKGVRQLVWPHARISLTLHIGLIEETLPQARFKADAWFLDGFSPAKNQAMWDETLWPLIADRSAAGARAATFTVAGTVRRGLTDAGFVVEKKPGHGRKRERLEAVYQPGQSRPANQPAIVPKVAIIGAGIAGACLATALHERGADVTVFDKAAAPAEGTSGNPLALVMPRLDAADTVQARLLVDAYLSAQAFYTGRPGVSVAETVHRPRSAAEQTRFEKVLADPPLGLEQLEALPKSGLLHKGSLVIEPARLLPDLLKDMEVKWATDAEIDAATRTVNGEAYDAIVLATGWQMRSLLPELGLTARLGQVESLEVEVDAPASAIASGPYAVATGHLRLWGATFEDHPGGEAQTSDAARIENMQSLEQLAPYWWQSVKQRPPQSRAGIRATTADRLPMIGAWPAADALQADRAQLERAAWHVPHDAYGQAGLHLSGGFGSRGFTWAPWAAAILRAQIFNDPIPAQSDALRAIVPIRHAVRKLKRKTAE
ncbi:MAG: FAD-dependent 5-carboxymethylaminomethyl-2-thiouridine(34) oxidoreductase MnmC [Pseudomonadota bacterium]